jgi:uridylate kinase
VDGVYNKDPRQHDDAERYETLTYNEALSQNLRVMDGTAFTLCQDNNIPIVVFDMKDGDNIRRALTGEEIGTIVCA